MIMGGVRCLVFSGRNNVVSPAPHLVAVQGNETATAITFLWNYVSVFIFKLLNHLYLKSSSVCASST